MRGRREVCNFAAVNPPEQQVRGGKRKLPGLLIHASELRRRQRGPFRIVQADDREVAGHGDVVANPIPDGGNQRQRVGNHDRGGRRLCRDDLCHSFGGQRFGFQARADQHFFQRNAGILQSLPVALKPLGAAHFRLAQVSDSLMPVFNQVPHRAVAALKGVGQQGVCGKPIHGVPNQNHRKPEPFEKGSGKHTFPVRESDHSCKIQRFRQCADGRQSVFIEVIRQRNGDIALLLYDFFQLFLDLILKQAAFFRQQDQHIAAFGQFALQCAPFRDEIRELVQLANSVLDLPDFLRTNVSGSVDHVRDGRHGHACYPSNILDRRHAFRPPAQNTFAFIIQIPFSIVNKICANAGFGTPEQEAGTGKSCVTLPAPAFVFPYAAFRDTPVLQAKPAVNQRSVAPALYFRYARDAPEKCAAVSCSVSPLAERYRVTTSICRSECAKMRI